MLARLVSEELDGEQVLDHWQCHSSRKPVIKCARFLQKYAWDCLQSHPDSNPISLSVQFLDKHFKEHLSDLEHWQILCRFLLIISHNDAHLQHHSIPWEKTLQILRAHPGWHSYPSLFLLNCAKSDSVQVVEWCLKNYPAFLSLYGGNLDNLKDQIIARHPMCLRIEYLNKFKMRSLLHHGSWHRMQWLRAQGVDVDRQLKKFSSSFSLNKLRDSNINQDIATEIWRYYISLYGYREVEEHLGIYMWKKILDAKKYQILKIAHPEFYLVPEMIEIIGDRYVLDKFLEDNPDLYPPLYQIWYALREGEKAEPHLRELSQIPTQYHEQAFQLLICKIHDLTQMDHSDWYNVLIDLFPVTYLRWVKEVPPLGRGKYSLVANDELEIFLEWPLADLTAKYWRKIADTACIHGAPRILEHCLQQGQYQTWSVEIYDNIRRHKSACRVDYRKRGAPQVLSILVNHGMVENSFWKSLVKKLVKYGNHLLFSEICQGCPEFRAWVTENIPKILKLCCRDDNWKLVRWLREEKLLDEIDLIHSLCDIEIENCQNNCAIVSYLLSTGLLDNAQARFIMRDTGSFFIQNLAILPSSFFDHATIELINFSWLALLDHPEPETRVLVLSLMKDSTLLFAIESYDIPSLSTRFVAQEINRRYLINGGLVVAARQYLLLVHCPRLPDTRRLSEDVQCSNYSIPDDKVSWLLEVARNAWENNRKPVPKSARSSYS